MQVQEMTACNMHRYLPADLNPKLREQLESALSASAQQQRQGGNAASASCPSPSMGPSLVKSSSQQGAKQKRTPSISNNQPSKDVSKHLNGKHAAGSTKAPIQLQAIASSNGSYSAPNRNSQQDALPVSREQCSPVPAMLPGVMSNALYHAMHCICQVTSEFCLRTSFPWVVKGTSMGKVCLAMLSGTIAADVHAGDCDGDCTA